MRFSLSRSRQTTGEYQQVLAWQTFVLTTYCCVIVAVPRTPLCPGQEKLKAVLGCSCSSVTPHAHSSSLPHIVRLQLPTSDFIKSSAKTGSSAFLVKGESKSVY